MRVLPEVTLAASRHVIPVCERQRWSSLSTRLGVDRDGVHGHFSALDGGDGQRFRLPELALDLRPDRFGLLLHESQLRERPHRVHRAGHVAQRRLVGLGTIPGQIVRYPIVRWRTGWHSSAHAANRRWLSDGLTVPSRGWTHRREHLQSRAAARDLVVEQRSWTIASVVERVDPDRRLIATLDEGSVGSVRLLPGWPGSVSTLQHKAPRRASCVRSRRMPKHPQSASIELSRFPPTATAGLRHISRQEDAVVELMDTPKVATCTRNWLETETGCEAGWASATNPVGVPTTGREDHLDRGRRGVRRETGNRPRDARLHRRQARSPVAGRTRTCGSSTTRPRSSGCSAGAPEPSLRPAASPWKAARKVASLSPGSMRNDSSSDVAAAEAEDEPSVTAVADEPAVTRERAPEVQPGDVLAGRYQIEAILGKGGSGVVLRAFDRVSATVVAVKVLKPGLTHDPRWEKRFSARAAASGRPIRHPNVCRIFDIGDADGYRFLTMEFATGGTLRDLIKKNQPLRPLAERLADAAGVDRRPGRDPRRRDRPPRRQARQHAAHGGRAPGAVRLRPRDRSSRQHDGQRLRRHAPLHGARGSRRRSGDHPLRRLVARRRPARDLLRQAAGAAALRAA